MLNIGGLSEGFVLDHIEAGRSMEIYQYLNLDKFDCCVAIIKNARSNKMGKKDIIKIECSIDAIDLKALGLIIISRSTSSKTTALWKRNACLFQRKSKMWQNAAIRAASLPLNRNWTTSLSSQTRKKRSTAANTAKRSTEERKDRALKGRLQNVIFPYRC